MLPVEAVDCAINIAEHKSIMQTTFTLTSSKPGLRPLRSAGEFKFSIVDIPLFSFSPPVAVSFVPANFVANLVRANR
jgi:hypothetical protein